MAPDIHPVPTSGPGSLSIGPCPPGGPDQGPFLRDLRAAGVTVVVSMLEAGEASSLGLGDAAQETRAKGLRFISRPLADFSVPSPEALHGMVVQLARLIRTGEGVFLHCRAGIGRSGMLACALLIAAGAPPAEAIATVSDARGQPVPDTEAQTRALHDFADAVAREKSRRVG